MHHFSTTRQAKEVCFRYDSESPVHCQTDRSCLSDESPLKLSTRITQSDHMHIDFAGWIDPIPPGGNSEHASGILEYTVSLLKIVELDPVKRLLEMRYPALEDLNKTDTSAEFVLPSEPAMYAIVLDVLDIAGNMRSARRFVSMT